MEFPPSLPVFFVGELPLVPFAPPSPVPSPSTIPCKQLRQSYLGLFPDVYGLFVLQEWDIHAVLESFAGKSGDSQLLDWSGVLWDWLGE